MKHCYYYESLPALAIVLDSKGIMIALWKARFGIEWGKDKECCNYPHGLGEDYPHNESNKD